MINKIAQIPWKQILQGVGATAAGAGLGYQVMPHLAGYQDVENARRAGGFVNAFNALALFLGVKKFGLKGLMEVAKQNPKATGLIGAGLMTEELAPVGIAAAHRLSKAPVAMANALQQQASKPNVPQAVGHALSTPIAKGVGAGMGVAGMGGLMTGLLRRQTEEEEKKQTPRAKMIAMDTLKYLVPAVVGGGVIGSLKQKAVERKQSKLQQLLATMPQT